MEERLNLLCYHLSSHIQSLTIRVDWRTVSAAAVTIVLWASAFAGIRAGLRSYSPQSVALLRYLTASAILAVYAIATKMPLPRLRDWPAIALSGFIGFTLYNITLNAGEQNIAAGTASLIIASAPIYVALLAVVFLHERLRLLAWLGVFLSFIGVAVVTLDPDTGLQLSSSAIIVLAAAVAQAIYIVGQKPLLRRYSPLQYTACAIWAGTFFLLVFSPGLVQQMSTASVGATLAVIYMGVFPAAIGYVSWSYVLSRTPASKAGSFLFLIPMVAIIIAWLWLGETPTIWALLGGVFILVGIVLVNTSGMISRRG
ncbi:MAG: EamA family transporter [Chloroflexi bacterium]|nr:EamA family transporter [Chloroflexota bacterium]